MNKRKPHNDLAGYIAEKRNQITGGHNIIFDCKLAEDQGYPIVENYKEEGGRYQVCCNEHGTLMQTTSMPKARELMKDSTIFCLDCRND